MTNLLAYPHVVVPRHVALEAYTFLRQVGELSLEAFAFWAGRVDSDVIRIEQAVVPQQVPIRSDDGVGVVVPGDELHRLNVWLYERRLTLVAQLHTHPGDAYHSETDDAFPIVTTLGGFSLVIPDFAKGPFDLAAFAVYRLMRSQEWIELTRTEVSETIVIED